MCFHAVPDKSSVLLYLHSMLKLNTSVAAFITKQESGCPAYYIDGFLQNLLGTDGVKIMGARQLLS